MKHLIRLLILLFAVLLLFGCDSRSSEMPEISINLETAKIYYPHISTVDEYTYYETKVEVTLTGQPDQTQNALIELTYDEEIIGIITNTGNAKLLKTNNSGIVEADIISRKEGIANINFKVKNWSTNANCTVTVSLPEITYLITDKENVYANNIDEASLLVRIMPPLPNRYVKFVSSIGVVGSDSVATNNNGIATNKFRSAVAGNALITAKLRDWQSQIKTLNINVLPEE
ncbi:MAG TPA: Ig-like domain-containing protein [Candidatus Cloacimonadota bacterium]|nr:Ig-like domain-containing protein [Candidatus Cloacimonadota bacterium]